MNALPFTFRDQTLHALPSGALFWPEQRLLCVSDLHLGKSERMARRGGALLPPYEGLDTLSKLDADLSSTGAGTVICLGDSFDDLAAADGLPETETSLLSRLMAGRRWIWIEGNHDPGPLEFGGSHLAEFTLAAFTFRHIAETDATGEISGHYHPKARLPKRAITRPAFLFDDARLILPAFGTYTGGLRSNESVLSDLMGPEARAILLAHPPVMIPMPRARRSVADRFLP